MVNDSIKLTNYQSWSISVTLNLERKQYFINMTNSLPEIQNRWLSWRPYLSHSWKCSYEQFCLILLRLLILLKYEYLTVNPRKQPADDVFIPLELVLMRNARAPPLPDAESPYFPTAAPQVFSITMHIIIVVKSCASGVWTLGDGGDATAGSAVEGVGGTRRRRRLNFDRPWRG